VWRCTSLDEGTPVTVVLSEGLEMESLYFVLRTAAICVSCYQQCTSVWETLNAGTRLQ